MGTILALDLGKFKSVACWYECGGGEVTFEAAPSARTELKELLTRRCVEVVVFEACTLAGWVYDLCQELGLKALVANTNGEAWRFKNLLGPDDQAVGRGDGQGTGHPHGNELSVLRGVQSGRQDPGLGERGQDDHAVGRGDVQGAGHPRSHGHCVGSADRKNPCKPCGAG
jgi:hypothetical protein